MFDRSLFRAFPFAVAVPALLVASAHAQEGQLVAEVVVRGTVRTAPQVAQTAASGAGLKVGEAFTSAAFTEARQRIREIGLYASVFGRTETTAEGKLRVLFEVVENPQVVKIDLLGNQSVAAKDLLPKLQTKAGDVLNTQTLNQDILRIQQEYQSRGFSAFVTNEVGIDPKTGVLTIPIQETIVESIEIERLKKTRPNVVLREMRQKVGAPFNKNTIQRDLQRIYNLGLFANVEGWRTEDGSDLGRVRLIVPVEEQRTGQVGVSVGYSVRQRLTGTLNYAENNLLGRGQSFNASWTVGGITAANQFDVGFTEPWIDRFNTSASVQLYNRVSYRFNRSLSSNLTSGTNTDQYYEERRGGSVTVARPLSDFTRVFATVRAETVRANNLQANYDQLTVDEINNIRGSLVSRGSVTSLSLRGVNNTRDSEQDPASGVYVSPVLEFGVGNNDYQDPTANPAFIDDTTTPGVPRALVSTRTQKGTFNKINFDIRNYYPLDGRKRSLDNLRQPKAVFATRLLLGSSGGNIGFSEQYFMGGADNLRGYNDDRFWGNNIFLLSNEVRFPLDKRAGTLNGVLFVDIGDAWGANTFNRENIAGFEQHGSFSPRVGFGFGVRVKTPVGPVRLDYGIGETSRTHFFYRADVLTFQQECILVKYLLVPAMLACTALLSPVAVVAAPQGATAPTTGQFGMVDVGKVLNDSKSRQLATAELDRTQRTFTLILQRLGQGSARFLSEPEIAELAALYEKDKPTDVEKKRLSTLEEKGDTLKRELTGLQNTQKPDDAQTLRLSQLSDLQDKGTASLDKLNRTLSTRLQEKARDAEQKSFAAVRASVAKIAKAKGLAVVFTGEIAFYATIDITDDVLKDVNK